ncbi:MAG: hypothetical protein K2G09_05955 [Paramuribaculum sp.]|nr:hypothetical protein [Paramuribaculum sp.]
MNTLSESQQEGRRFLNLAFDAWKGAQHLREGRKRFMKFTFGDQWSDITVTPMGEILTEKEWATRSGARPLTNNLIRRAVKTVVGVFRTNHPKSFTRRLRDTLRLNNITELDSRAFEEFLISGCAIQRVISERRPAGNGIWVDNVAPDRFFVNRFSDPRGIDIELIGMIHDMSTAELHSRFSMKKDQVRRNPGQNSSDALPISFADRDFEPFFTPAQGKHRVIEVWTLESMDAVKGFDPVSGSFFMAHGRRRGKLQRINRRRKSTDRIAYTDFHTVRWVCRWISADGVLLDKYISQFPHSSYPFAVKFYPLTDGRVHPFIEDIIDQQKYINRMITLIDSIMSTSAKGVLLFPEDRKPNGMSWIDIDTLWGDCRGVIPIKSSTRTNDMPVQITTSGATADAHKLLGTQLDLMKHISGVSPALSGETVSSHDSASLQTMLRENSQYALADIFGAFESFIEARNNLVETTEL